MFRCVRTHTHAHTHIYIDRYLYIQRSFAETRGLTRIINSNGTFRDTNSGIKKFISYQNNHHYKITIDT